MFDHPFLSGRFAVEQAEAMVREHGDDAGLAAAMRVQMYRGRDNAVMFCRWREVERLVALSGVQPGQTIH